MGGIHFCTCNFCVHRRVFRTCARARANATTITVREDRRTLVMRGIASCLTTNEEEKEEEAEEELEEEDENV